MKIAKIRFIFIAISFMFVVIIFNGHTTHAGERFDFYDGIREEALGGSAVAVVNDETALLLNPAALGRLRNYFVTVFDPEIELGSETQAMVGTSTTDFLSPQKTLDDCNKHLGDLLHQRIQLFPSFVVTNFGFGLYGRYATDANVDSGNTKFTYDYRNDFAGVLGFDFRMFDGRIKIGANVRAVDRTESARTDIPLNSTGLSLTSVVNGSTIASEGFGIGSDAGIILTAPWEWLPTLAAVYHDIGTTSYDINSGMTYSTTNRPQRTPATLDAGFSLNPILGSGVRMTFTAEMRDVMNTVEPTSQYASSPIMRRIHGGIEFNFGDLFFLRGGLNQGYWTAGIELNMLNTQLQVASYGEEVGDVPATGSGLTYKPVEDRRYVVKFAYRF